jgi:ubiquinol-cytochrome c reductase cytochrome c subunit
MTGRQARLLTWTLRVGLVVAIVGQVAWSFRPTVGRAQADQEALGQRLFENGCITCHGVDGIGTELGPSLEGVGTASVDFFLSSGRMPLAKPGDQPIRQPPAYTDEEIAAFVAYLRPIVDGGPEIPAVETAGADLSRGSQLFLNSCAACHGAGAGGASIGGGQIAPSLVEPTAQQIVEAIRIGPGLMPRWNERTIDAADAEAVAAYLVWLRDNADEGGIQLGRVGAVAEGLIAVVVGLGLILLVIRLTRADT